jgi:hypothetical protein
MMSGSCGASKGSAAASARAARRLLRRGGSEMLSDGSEKHRSLSVLVRQVRYVPVKGRWSCGYVSAMRRVVSSRTLVARLSAATCCATMTMLLGTILRQLKHDGDLKCLRLVAWMSAWFADDSSGAEKFSGRVRSTELRWIQKKSCSANRRPYSRRG